MDDPSLQTKNKMARSKNRKTRYSDIYLKLGDFRFQKTYFYPNKNFKR